METFPNPNPFTPLNGTLESLFNSIQSKSSYSGTGDGEQYVEGDVSELGGYCDAWKRASTTKQFQNSQLKCLGEMYLAPAQAMMDSMPFPSSPDSLPPVLLGQLYDSVVQLGEQGCFYLIINLILTYRTRDLVRKMSKSLYQDPYKWTLAFLQERTKKLQEMSQVYAATVTRVKSYQCVLDNNQDQDWEKGKISALNNDGNVCKFNQSQRLILSF